MVSISIGETMRSWGFSVSVVLGALLACGGAGSTEDPPPSESERPEPEPEPEPEEGQVTCKETEGLMVVHIEPKGDKHRLGAHRGGCAWEEPMLWEDNMFGTLLGAEHGWVLYKGETGDLVVYEATTGRRTVDADYQPGLTFSWELSETSVEFEVWRLPQTSKCFADVQTRWTPEETGTEAALTAACKKMMQTCLNKLRKGLKKRGVDLSGLAAKPDIGNWCDSAPYGNGLGARVQMNARSGQVEAIRGTAVPIGDP
jgi:hypothetical protein